MVEGVKMTHRRNYSATRILFVLIIPILFLQGCGILPIPTGGDKVLAGDQITNDELSFIRPGITTKKEVVERLGEPTVFWEDERIFAYNWQMRLGILLWFYVGTGGAEDITKKYVLLIRFDPNDRVERFEVTRGLVTVKAWEELYERVKPDSYGEHLENWLKKIEEPQPAEAKKQSDGN